MHASTFFALLALPLATATGALHSVCFANASTVPAVLAPHPQAAPKASARPNLAMPTLYYPVFETEVVFPAPIEMVSAPRPCRQVPLGDSPTHPPTHPHSPSPRARPTPGTGPGPPR